MRRSTSESAAAFGLGLRQGTNTANIEAASQYQKSLQVLSENQIFRQMRSQASLGSIELSRSQSQADAGPGSASRLLPGISSEMLLSQNLNEDSMFESNLYNQKDYSQRSLFEEHRKHKRSLTHLIKGPLLQRKQDKMA